MVIQKVSKFYIDPNLTTLLWIHKHRSGPAEILFPLQTGVRSKLIVGDFREKIQSDHSRFLVFINKVSPSAFGVF